MIMCIKTTFDQGIKNGGGIGQYLDASNDKSLASNYIASRFFFDDLFNIIIMIIMMMLWPAHVVVHILVVLVHGPMDVDLLCGGLIVCHWGIGDVIERD